MRKIISLLFAFAVAAGAAAAPELPEVNRPPSQAIAPVAEFDFAAEVDSDRIWIETAAGERKPTAGFQKDGSLKLAPGDVLVCDAALLPAAGTIAVRLRVADADTGSGTVVSLPFGSAHITMGKGQNRPMWLVGIPGAESADGKLPGRGEIPSGQWGQLAVGYTADKIQFHVDRRLVGEGKAGIVEHGREIRIGDRGGKLPLEIKSLAIYDIYFDFNDVLKALYRDSAAVMENSGGAAIPAAGFAARPRPRVLATAETFRDIRELAETDADMIELLKRHVRRFDLSLADGPDRPEPFGELKREEGNRLAMLAVLYRSTGEKRYLDKAVDYIRAIVDYHIWDGNNPYWTNLDLATGHLLLGLGIAYDYLYDDLPPEVKRQMREVVRFRAGDLTRRIIENSWNWGDRVMNNHGCVVTAGLLTAAVGFAGDLPEAGLWAKVAHDWLKKFFAGQPPDGGDFEGVGYSQYSLAHAMIAAELARSDFGVDYFKESAWLRHAMDFRIQSSIPEKHWVKQQVGDGVQRLDFSLLSFGDTRQRDFFVPTGFARKLAAEYGRGDYLTFADKVSAIDNFCHGSEYLSLLYLQAAKKSGLKAAPYALPTFGHYPDVDKVLMRSDWSGDESMLIFRSGPPTGHRALHEFSGEQGDGHVHPDVGGISLFAAGELFIINSDYCHKLTVQENTLTVNGVGQIGDDQKWTDNTPYYQRKLEPKILLAETGESADYVIGDATSAYKPEAGLKKFHRHILFIKPDCWIILDDVAANEPSTFEMRYHSLLGGDAAGKHGFFAGSRGKLQFRTLLPRDGELTFGETEIRLIDRATAPRKTSVIKLANAEKATERVFVTVLAAGPKDGDQDFSAAVADDVITIVKGGKTHRVKINRQDGLKLEYLVP